MWIQSVRDLVWENLCTEGPVQTKGVDRSSRGWKSHNKTRLSKRRDDWRRKMRNKVFLPSPALASQRPFPDQARALTQEVCAESRLCDNDQECNIEKFGSEKLAAKRACHNSWSDELKRVQLNRSGLTWLNSRRERPAGAGCCTRLRHLGTSRAAWALGTRLRSSFGPIPPPLTNSHGTTGQFLPLRPREKRKIANSATLYPPLHHLHSTLPSPTPSHSQKCPLLQLCLLEHTLISLISISGSIF